MTRTDSLIAFAVMALWGFNFSVIKLGADQINPLLLTTLRFTFAVFPLILFIPRPSVPFKYLFGYGLCFGVGVWGMMTCAIHMGLSAGMAGFTLQLSLVFSVFIAIVWFKEHLPKAKLIGAALVLLGLLFSFTLEDGTVPLSSLVLVLISGLCWSLMSVIVKKANTKQIFAFSVWGMVFALPSLILITWLFYGVEVFLALPEQINGKAWFSILFQAYPTTLLGYWLWNNLVSRYPISTTALWSPLVPVFGLIGSLLFYGESLSIQKLVVVGLILLGVIISHLQFSAFTAKKPLSH